MPASDQPANPSRPRAPDPTAAPTPTRRLPRAQRRDQILAAATSAFARAGFTATSLDDIAAEAGISKVLLYRHFDSKTDLYRAVLDRARTRLGATVGTRDFTMASIPTLLQAAAEDPDGFRLLFRHAAREPEFRAEMDQFRATSVAVARRELARGLPDPEPAWLGWAAHLVPTVALEAVMAWLDAGQPDPDQAADRIGQAIGGVVHAARPRLPEDAATTPDGSE